MRRLRALPLVTGVLVLLTACGGARAVDTGSSTLLVGERSGASMDALLSGTLVETDGCVGIEATDSGAAFAVVWPHGTTVTDDDPLTIDVPDVGEVALGEDVRVGGGVVSVDESDEGDEVGGVEIPAFCAGPEVWLAG